MRWKWFAIHTSDVFIEVPISGNLAKKKQSIACDELECSLMMMMTTLWVDEAEFTSEGLTSTVGTSWQRACE